MKNKRKIIAIIASLLIIVLIAISLIYFNTQENNVEIKSSLKEYNAELEENEHMHIEEDIEGEKVPVPNGYVGSRVDGENEIDTGYVIYEGIEEINDSNVEEAQKTRNQYVWVPVPDVSKFYGTDENGKKWGKLYEFTADSGNNIDEVTGAKPLNWSENNKIITLLNQKSSREPDIATNRANIAYDSDSKIKLVNVEERSTHEFLIQLEQEFNSMVESVKKYGGFYIGRYETGDLSKDKAVVTKGNIDIKNETWYTMYRKCKNLNNGNINVATGIIWGNQWDRTLIWLVESGNRSREDICENSTGWGNFRNSSFEYINSNGNTSIKNENSNMMIPTGSTEYTNANNIYDLAGNVSEWTMENSYTYIRIGRGGYSGGNDVLSLRYELYPDTANASRRLPCDVIYKIIKEERYNTFLFC